jgi:hypothetical protein
MTIRSRAYLAFAAAAFCAAASDAGAAIKQEPIPPLLPPQGQLKEPAIDRVAWPWYVAAGCLIVSSLLMWPRKPRPVFTEDPATRALRKLREIRPPEPVALGAILREYVVATQRVPGPGQTFEELAAHLERDLRWTPALRARFRKLADPVEIAKFAPGAPALNLEAIREEALSIVESADALQRPPVPAPR